ncbi:Hypothetical protein AA314_01974 [Archangium gephyra]|uniref:Uncharacterized protein n=1 Tax=Archangium gephyra TaxID=48 RepID=A0AAC8Q3E7_9BACT|nr:Hypothetical protein AA314_01974 [Archangium gephyra]
MLIVLPAPARAVFHHMRGDRPTTITGASGVCHLHGVRGVSAPA